MKKTLRNIALSVLLRTTRTTLHCQIRGSSSSNYCWMGCGRYSAANRHEVLLNEDEFRSFYKLLIELGNVLLLSQLHSTILVLWNQCLFPRAGWTVVHPRVSPFLFDLRPRVCLQFVQALTHNSGWILVHLRISPFLCRNFSRKCRCCHQQSCWLEQWVGLLCRNKSHRSCLASFVFITQIWDCSEKTELINRHNCAKNSFNRSLVSAKVYWLFSTSCAFERSSWQWARNTENWVSALCKFDHHQFSDSIPFSSWSVNVSRIPLLSWSRSDEWPVSCGISNTFRFTVIKSPYDVINTDMKMIRPWKCSGSHILFMNFRTSWTSCNVVNPGKIFHSNSIGSPSILSKFLYSGVLFEPFQSLFPCYVRSRVLVHLAKTQYRIWKYVNFCALKIDDLFITNQRQVLPWRVFPINVFTP